MAKYKVLISTKSNEFVTCLISAKNQLNMALECKDFNQTKRDKFWYETYKRAGLSDEEAKLLASIKMNEGGGRIVKPNIIRDVIQYII